MNKIWKCDGNDARNMPEQIWKKKVSILSDTEEIIKTLRLWQKIQNRKEIILPLVQNIEGVVLGAGVAKKGRFWTTGEYPFSDLREINPENITLMKKKPIQAILEVIKQLKDEPIILEVEAPFSVLASLIDPMNLYLAMDEESDILNNILEKIVLEEIEYLEAVTSFGCHIISLAEPTGTIDMIGEKYFKKYSGRASVMLLRESQKFLQNSIIHLCGKLSNSMLALHMAMEKKYVVNGEDYFQHLMEAANNPEIFFVGQHCIHQKRNEARLLHSIKLLGTI